MELEDGKYHALGGEMSCREGLWLLRKKVDGCHAGRGGSPPTRVEIGRDVMQGVEVMPCRDGKGFYASYRDVMQGGR